MGPLHGMKVIEIGGIGPVPFCGMMLSDMGASIVRVEKKDQFKKIDARYDILTRNRRSIIVDLKKKEGVDVVLRMVDQADVLQEGFRPGIMEQLGLGPDVCLARNPRLVYGRMTGWGQEGPLSGAAGHDINYIALSGALHGIGRAGQKPVVPSNLLGDFGGGGMLLAFGIVCALFEARQSGKGQVVDAAIVDGVASLMAMAFSFRASGCWMDSRGESLLDGGAPFYDTYETAEGKYIAIGAIEPKFYARLLQLAGLTNPDFQDQMDQHKWPGLKEKLEKTFKTKTRDAWCAIMEGSDACFTPVLTLDEAALHPHNQARKTFSRIDGVLQNMPAPRFTRTRPEILRSPPIPGEHAESILSEFNFTDFEIEMLKTVGAISSGVQE